MIHTNEIVWYLLSVLISAPLVMVAAKRDFGSVTIGGFLVLSIIILAPFGNVPVGIFLWLSTIDKAKDAFSSTLMKILNKRIL